MTNSIFSYRTNYQYNINGDIDHIQKYDSTGQRYQEFLYTYDNHPNGFGMIAKYENIASVFPYTPSAHNLIKAVSISYDGASNDTSVVRYSYNYNSNGYPTLQTVMSSDTVMHTLDYNCY